MNPLQNHILDIYKVVSSVCENRDIPYFAIGGSVIGAVRHKGFIPWDDDMDIAIPIEWRSRFLEAMEEDLPSNYLVSTAFNNPGTTNLIMKVVDCDTTYIRHGVEEMPEAWSGVWLDVFILCGLPDRGCKLDKYANHLGLLATLDRKIKRPYSPKFSIKGKVAWIALSPVRAIVPRNTIAEKRLKIVSENGFYNSIYVGTYAAVGDALGPFGINGRPKYIGVKSNHSYALYAWERSWFDEYEYLKFEDTYIKAPKCWHQYLTYQYGDYMTMPPKEKQHSHPGFVDLEHSFMLYRQGALEFKPEMMPDESPE